VEAKGDEISIINLVHSKVRKVHRKQIVPFRYDPTRTDPYEVAMKDKQESQVAEIIDIIGIDGKKKANIQIRVRWAGEGPEKDLWLDWKDMRNNEILHQYLWDHKLYKLLPAYVWKQGNPNNDINITPQG
jgi:hypothetical protein